tara:strand:- start:139 stop:339 length:201 start_codon:yes stop_codon:yes gene_type:complete
MNVIEMVRMDLRVIMTAALLGWLMMLGVLLAEAGTCSEGQGIVVMDLDSSNDIHGEDARSGWGQSI